MIKIFVDTNILIDYVNGFNDELETLFVKQEQKNIELCINPVILTEFFNDRELYKKGKMNTALEFVNLFRIIDINRKIGIIAGELLRTNAVSVLADAFVAATCIHCNLILFTNNKKDFQKVKGLKLR